LPPEASADNQPVVATKGKGKKGSLPGHGAYGREFMTEKDWEAKFELLMIEDLIDLP
jgi:hypothetical protein